MNNIEQHLEEYCRQEKIPFQKIKESIHKTPDYKLYPKGIPIIAEIKGFERGKEDKQLEIQKVVSRAEPLGMRRIRDKIIVSSRQFEKYHDRPTLLILCGITPSNVDLSTEIVEMAMFGDISYVFSIDGSLQPSVTQGEWEFGRNAPSQILRKSTGSLISAIAVLERININRKIIENNLKHCVKRAEINNLKKKEILIKALECVDDTKVAHPYLNFEEYRLRLRIIYNPYANIAFPPNIFDSPWDQMHMPKLAEPD